MSKLKVNRLSLSCLIKNYSKLSRFLALIFKSKIHRAKITEANLYYEGSITIDEKIMKAAGILPYEQVMVSNLNNGERFETYVISGKSGSGEICLNGPTARKGVAGDKVIVFCGEHFGIFRNHEVFLLVGIPVRECVLMGESAQTVFARYRAKADDSS